MGITKYTDKSFVVFGSVTLIHKADLLALGGKYNPNLQGGPGYIFANPKWDEVEHFVDQCNGVGVGDENGNGESGDVAGEELAYLQSKLSEMGLQIKTLELENQKLIGERDAYKSLAEKRIG